jgi:hypothetical protein
MLKKSHGGILTCPQCNGHQLLPFEQDYICGCCDWNSFESSVAAGQLDDLIYEYECTIGHEPLPRGRVVSEEVEKFHDPGGRHSA